jgi:hypothetical protein
VTCAEGLTTAGFTLTTVAAAGARDGTIAETCGFASSDHPDDRRPQLMHRRKMAPGSHHAL